MIVLTTGVLSVMACSNTYVEKWVRNRLRAAAVNPSRRVSFFAAKQRNLCFRISRRLHTTADFGYLADSGIPVLVASLETDDTDKYFYGWVLIFRLTSANLGSDTSCRW
jgi:hypothetical protein